MKTRLLTHPASKSITENQLVEGLKQKDNLAFRRIYKMYSASLMGILIKIVNQQETAEDLLQECFVRISRNIDSYDPAKGKLFTWMLNLSRNLAIDHMRLRSSRNEKKTFEMDDVQHEIQYRTSQSFNTDAIGLKNLVARLPEKHQLMINLTYYQGYSHAEIAEMLHMPLGSVKTAIRLAIVNLRKTFLPEELVLVQTKSA
ncbi:RNA polymerase sigma factor [Pedobacter soli]|uniref:RNA polymerase sigma-70 factor, ECF subfamily n=1 Tax=Pedobacter soli TaxID=390242 RepID=A0A1G6VGW5_9SPHI|nr:sigma-70 family RNA polymerase sigma factor [Pedobacter soli]SDD52165.1 RNA polymerase sigma-70 factor, ECF subfamily [Pedobacter soli]